MSENSDEQFCNMVAYFWNHKGDPTKYIKWDEERCRRVMPKFYDAWQAYLAALAKLNEVVEKT